MAWQKVAEGVSLYELRQTVADMELPKGSKIRVVMDTWAWWAFDVAGAELAFKPFVPDGVELLDVYGESGRGIVDMEADPITLAGFILFVKTHWLALTILGLALAAIISYIVVFILTVALGIPWWVIPVTVGGVCALGIVVIAAALSKRG